MSVYLIGTLDTKGREVAFVAQRLRSHGVGVVILDSGCLGESDVSADIAREDVFAAAGTSLQAVRDAGDRGQAVTLAASGVSAIVRRDFDAGRVDAVMALGGSAGTMIGAAAMRSLPLGIPKVMVSTMASGQTRPYVGGRDIFMLNSVVDIAGINRISRIVLTRAADAVAGMLQSASECGEAEHDDRPLIAATMFGVTTPCVLRAQSVLEAAGYEVLVFHATGNGGEAMEGLIRDGLIAGVLDITTTELADELVGGVLSAGPDRLTAAAKAGVPQVISVGALDMVNFGAPETIPERLNQRRFHKHNATVTLMRTTSDECRRLGEEIGRKAATSKVAVSILFPSKGISAIDAEGQPFDDPAARDALLNGILSTCGTMPVDVRHEHINDASFAEAAAKKLLELIAAS